MAMTDGRVRGAAAELVVVGLDDTPAIQVELTGAKAANLARASRASLDVLPGFVITTRATAVLLGDDDEAARVATELEIEAAWSCLSNNGARPLVVRSSSVIEDGGASSMAGMFTSVLDVRGWPAFLDALHTVLRSAKSVPGIEQAPMAVLVQPMLTPRFGGVLFGVDPVTGRRDRLVVAAVEGGPDRLVSGLVQGAHYELSPSGRVRRAVDALEGLDRRDLRRLADLAARAERAFGGPQDIEWAIGTDGAVHLLQARPVTATAAPEVKGPVLGPGPVSETLPGVLSTLEQDLWLDPLRRGVAEALRLAGVATERRIRRSPVVTAVDGQAVADLDLFGVTRRRGFIGKLDPRPGARRLAAAWRVGRLRSAAPALASDLVDRTDELLLDVPPLDELTPTQLVELLRRAREVLVAVHGQEVLAGLLHEGTASQTGIGVAIETLAAARARGERDEEIIATAPVVLALTRPHVGPAEPLPPVVALPPQFGSTSSPADPSTDVGLLREALRLRARWLQELMARAAWTLAATLVDSGALDEPEQVNRLHFDELAASVAGQLDARRAIAGRRPVEGAPVPSRFRLSDDGRPVAVADAAAQAGQGAGGGRVTGIVHHHDGSPPPAGSVLVVRTLDPALAPYLPELGGLVAETGSVLSHLAILAREFGVATVVNVPGALARFAPGSTVVVDGRTGEVTPAEPPTPAPAMSSPAAAPVGPARAARSAPVPVPAGEGTVVDLRGDR